MPHPEPTSPNEPEITLKVILDHIQAFKSDVSTKLKKIEEELKRLERKVDANDEKWEQRFMWFRAGVDNLDARVEDLETKRIPKIEKKVRQLAQARR